VVQVQLQDLLAKGWIRSSKSPYGAPIFLVRKKDGTMRMCVDCRKLNDLTRKDRTPLPRIDELLDSLYVAHYFSTLDMYKGYHQVRVKERDIHKDSIPNSLRIVRVLRSTLWIMYRPNWIPSDDESSFGPVSWQVLRGISGRRADL
jgi:hypothetical protein